MTTKLSVGVLGCGYWGPNLIRNFSACPLTQVTAVCDANPERLAAVARKHGDLRQTRSLDELLEQPIDAVAIATPVSTHFALAERCLEAGKHVLVEKPLAANAAEGQYLVDLAARRGLTLMVDHTYLFSNAIRRIKELVEHDELGELYYVDSVRINLGLFQNDVNVIWDLAPHDLAIADHVLGYPARSISAWGCAHANPGIEDVAYVNVDYGDQMMANFHVNWLSPVKVRQIIFAGARKSLIFNELNTTEPIKVYDRGIELGEGAEQRQKLMVNYRTGDVWSPHVAPGEPLQAMVAHFARCVRGEEEPISGGHLGLRVVRLLEAATRSIRAQGGRVVFSNGAPVNGNGHARAQRSEQRHPYLPGRPAGEERGDSLLREPVRVPAGG
jgi:predicted dehydrogenase